MAGFTSHAELEDFEELAKKKGKKFKPFTSDIDFDLLQQWLKTCKASHGESCNDKSDQAILKHITELYLVDVMSGCLVLMPCNTRFVALSYVWGSSKQFMTTSRNLQELMTPGALFRNKDKIANTVRDAMHVVKRLDERYLWVDCLCIVQDGDTVTMEKTLKAMAYIYTQAEFTIAAAGGEDANHGIRGIGGPSSSREWRDVKHTWDLLCTEGYPDGTVWTKRGWTFQESLFSRRLLVFNGIVTWLCGRCVEYECFENTQHEDLQWPVERSHLGVPMGMMSLLSDLPALGRWGMIVQDYSRRNLTYEADVERAFAGASEVMGRRFPGGFIQGCPVFFFDLAMLWRSSNFTERRLGYPSWSWTGWKGRVDYWSHWDLHYSATYRETGDSDDWIVMAPLKPVACYQLILPDGTPHDMSLNGFYAYQGLRDQRSGPLPPGWECHDHPDGHFYTKSGADRSRYAFPLPSVHDLDVPSQIPQLSSALLVTSLAVEVTVAAVPVQFLSSLIEVYIYNSNCGTTLVLSEKDAMYGDRTDLGLERGVLIHLIVLSEAENSLPERTSEWIRKQTNFPQYGAEGLADKIGSIFTPSFYNILWIQWEDGVAYRKAIGMINKDAFHALDPKRTTVELG